MIVGKSLKLPDVTCVDVIAEEPCWRDLLLQKYFCTENLLSSLPGYEFAFLGDLVTSQFLRAQQWEAELFPSCLRHQGWSWHHPCPNLCISFNWSQIAGFCSAGCSHPVVNSLASRKSTGTATGVSHHLCWWTPRAIRGGGSDCWAACFWSKWFRSMKMEQLKFVGRRQVRKLSPGSEKL